MSVKVLVECVGDNEGEGAGEKEGDVSNGVGEEI